ncbi:ABC transporter permease, partial [Staphylococcus warneri]
QVEGVFDVIGVFVGMLVLIVFVLFIDWGVFIVEECLFVWCLKVAGYNG